MVYSDMTRYEYNNIEKKSHWFTKWVMRTIERLRICFCQKVKRCNKRLNISNLSKPHLHKCVKMKNQYRQPSLYLHKLIDVSIEKNELIIIS